MPQSRSHPGSPVDPFSHFFSGLLEPELVGCPYIDALAFGDALLRQ